jgi:hypothetical protein
MTEQEKITALAGLLLRQRQERLGREASLEQAGWEQVEVTPGRKYTRIDRGTASSMSGALMVEHGTGIIYGILGYGKVDKRSRYGTLDTTDRFYWGDI